MTTYEGRVLLDPRDSLSALQKALFSGAPAQDLRSILSPALLTAAVSVLTEMASRLTRTDLGDVLADGWRQYARLRQAAHASLADPDSPTFVETSQHTISWRTSPRIQLVVDGVPTWHFTLTIRCTLDLNALLAKVENAAITALLAGRCRGTATLFVNERQILERSVDVDVFEQLPLRRPIRLRS